MSASEDFIAAAAMPAGLTGHAGRLWSSDFQIANLSEHDRAELRQRISIELAHNEPQLRAAMARMQKLVDEDRSMSVLAAKLRGAGAGTP